MSNRVIKEQVIDSESLAIVSAEAERLFWRLVVMVDDWGWMAADPVALRPRALPRLVDVVTVPQFESWMDELASGRSPLAELWVFHGKPYLRLTGAAERNGQPIHFWVRAKKSKYPVADAIASATRVSSCEQMHAVASRCAQPQAAARNRAQMLAPARICMSNGNGNGNENKIPVQKEMPAPASGSLPEPPASQVGGSPPPETAAEGEEEGDASTTQIFPAESPPKPEELVLDGGAGPPDAKADRERFEAWWTAYRTRTGRGTDKEDTWKAYQRLQEQEKARLLRWTLEWFDKRDRLAAAKVFVPEAPDAKRFLRKRRWLDELAVPSGSAARAAPGGEGRDWAKFKPDVVMGDEDDEPHDLQPDPAG